MIIVVKIMVIVSLLLIVFCVFNTIRYYRRENKDYMSFRESLALSDLPVITFFQNGIKLNFLFDTGANISVINKSMLNSLSYKETDRISKISGIGGGLSDIPIVDIEFTYKDNTFTDGFQVVDMNNTFSAIKKSTGVTIHGMIGNAFMQKYKYVLDFDEMIAYSKK